MQAETIPKRLLRQKKKMSQILIIFFAFFVQFADKSGSEHIALSEYAIEKRVERGIAIDSLDYAVSPIYIDSLLTIGCHIHHTSRWMNGATIEADSITIQKIRQWSFVDSIYLTRMERHEIDNTAATHHDREEDDFGFSSQSLRKKAVEYIEIRHSSPLSEGTYSTQAQIEQLNLHLLHQLDFQGQGVIMAVIDGGFQHADTLSAFDKVRAQILGTYDMTDDEDSMFSATSNHGTKCFGTIAAMTDDYHGAAVAAYYYLIRSEEHYTESPKEMDNWVAAIELADSLGVDIVSSSLGYSLFDDEVFALGYAMLDGQTTRCAQAAQIAADKGMLVVIAAGNEGDKTWHHISTPGDADDILTVGAVDINDSIASFSSWGPSADGRVKPEVCAMGYQTALIHPIDNSSIYGNGTSFACPIIAGMAACLWSAIPYANNKEIRERIIQSANRYAYPHEQYGYGIPDAWVAYTRATDIEEIKEEHTPKAKKVLINGNLWILYNGKRYNVMGYKHE